MSNPGVLRDWIERLPGDGRYVFSRQDALSATDASEAAVKMTLYRLKRTGAIVSPRRDFSVVVPPEYRSAGCPPASWFVDDLMRHLGRRYYVSLLSAAALHGAGHQQPMAFQVMVDAPERRIEVGRVRIEFHVSRLVAQAQTQVMPTETGGMVVSTPETTAFDLVRFPAACGHWSHVATVLSELAEMLDTDLLALGMGRVARSDAQRLWWLLDFLRRPLLADAIGAALVGSRLAPAALNKLRDVDGALLDARWQVLVNDDLEPDT